MAKYTIKPLRWRKNIVSEYVRSYWCDLGPFGDYVIQQLCIAGKWSRWTVTYSLHLYGTSVIPSATSVTSRAGAEALAEWDWACRLSSILKRAK